MWCKIWYHPDCGIRELRVCGMGVRDAASESRRSIISSVEAPRSFAGISGGRVRVCSVCIQVPRFLWRVRSTKFDAFARDPGDATRRNEQSNRAKRCGVIQIRRTSSLLKTFLKKKNLYESPTEVVTSSFYHPFPWSIILPHELILWTPTPLSSTTSEHLSIIMKEISVFFFQIIFRVNSWCIHEIYLM